MKRSIFFSFVVLLTTSYSQTFIPSGDVYGTWTILNSPYQVLGDITIPNDSTLIIEPGVSVIFEGHYTLNVQGRLLAVGAEGNEITFTINDTTGFHDPHTTPGGWNGIQFIDTPTDNDTSKIIFCTLQYGKAVGSTAPDKMGGAIYIGNFNNVIIANCLITNNSAGGTDSPSGGGLALFVANITLANNTFSNNHAWDGGAIQIYESDVIFRDNVIKQNRADEGGGGIWIGGLSNIEFNNDSLIGNVSGNNGGGIICWQTSNTSLDSVTFNNNLANFGGAIAAYSCEMQLDNCSIVNNVSSMNGGGINSDNSTIIINNTIFSGDTSTLSGGAIGVNNTNLSINNCAFIDNGTGIRGGAIHSNSSTINIINTSFERDTSTIYGGAIQVNYSELVIDSCNLVDNIAGDAGGGIHSDFSNINVTNTTFERDIAGESGGAIVAVQSNLIINYCEFYSNTATSYSGGAIRNVSSPLTINNSNLIDNGAGILGGGIHADFSTINITSTTFERDSAGESGGAIFTWQCDLVLDNCDFNNNSVNYHGGAICSDSSSIIIDNTNFIQNVSIWGGGIKSQHGVLQMNNSSFIENSSEHGGAIYFESGTTELTNISFEQNSSIWGGAMDAFNTTMLIDSCTFFQNEATENGGGIQYHIDTTEFSQAYVFELLNSNFIENAAFYRGALDVHQFNSETSLIDVKIDKCGFINNSIDRAANLSITGFIDDFIISNSIFRGNTAVVRTATCQFNDYAKGKVSNSVFTSNYTGGGGSAVSIGLGSDVEFVNCSFANNLGTLGAALTQRVGGSATFINSIFWGNRPYNIILSAVNDTTPCSLNVNYCDIEYGLDSIVVSDTVSVVNWDIGNIDSDPLFVDTLNNDFHLQDLSPCIAAGIDSIEIAGFWHYAPLTDIEGNPRPYPEGTMPDMGAYESQYPVNVEDNNLNLPTEFALYQNYPNPFNPTTTIKYSVPKISFVTIKIYDVLGSEVVALVNEEKPVGTYELNWNAANLPSGVYFYRLQAGGFVQTRKMILLK